MGSGSKGFGAHWTLPMDIDGQQQKNQLDLCQNVRVMSILVFFSGERVNGGRVGGKRQAGVKDFELTGPCQWTLVTNSKKNRLDSCQNGQVMTILHSWWIPPLPVSSAPF